MFCAPNDCCALCSRQPLCGGSKVPGVLKNDLPVFPIIASMTVSARFDQGEKDKRNVLDGVIKIKDQNRRVTEGMYHFDSQSVSRECVTVLSLFFFQVGPL